MDLNYRYFNNGITFIASNASTQIRNRIKTSHNNKEKIYKFAIFIHGKRNDDAMITAFGATFVHSCDAFIVHDILNNVHKTNIKLKEAGLPEIRMLFNHDCFIIDAYNAFLLQALVRVSYNQVYIMRKQIPELEKENKGITNILCTNPNFIRY
jgi:hypothetical protein